MRRLLMISLDAIGDDVYDRLVTRSPHFAGLVEQSQVHRGVSSVFLTNTYPVHVSIATGLVPKYHGIISNKHPFPIRYPKWCYEANQIKAKTLWQAAAEKGLKSATIMWPVTAGAGDIFFNIPELSIHPNENQIVMNLKYGSKLFQLHMMIKYGKLLGGKDVKQPNIDNFSTACMEYLLRKKMPDLAMIHLTCYDFLCHEHGLDSPELEVAYEAVNKNLGTLLDAANGQYDILLFSDHSQLPAANSLLPNSLLEKKGYIHVDNNGEYLPGNCFFECNGGSAFLHPGDLSKDQIEELKDSIKTLDGFGRMLRDNEMDECGRAGLPFGFAAKPGWACEVFRSGELANHGYPVDYDRYKVFYLCHGVDFAPELINGGSLLEVTAQASKVLDLDMKNSRGFN